MDIVVLFALFLVPVLTPKNPIPGRLGSKSELRDLDCERQSATTAQRSRPGEVTEPQPRGDYAERSVVVCQERWMASVDRAARDEAILTDLEATATSLASAAQALDPTMRDRTWVVETYYPSGPVATKVSFATKNALVLRGLRVSDRTPTLGAGDIDVLTRMDPTEAYPTACGRYFDVGSLGANDALLAVVSRDPRETALHAGVCVDGQWQWLR